MRKTADQKHINLRKLIARELPLIVVILLAWNILLSAVLIYMHRQSQEPFKNEAPSPATQTPLYQPGPIALSDSFARGNPLLDNYNYQFGLNIPAGSITAIWQNQQPIISQIADSSGYYQFDFDLEEGENNLSIGIWSSQQHLLYKDHWIVSVSSEWVRQKSQSITRGPLDSNNIALTFDGGSLAEGALEVLNILWSHNIHTTMFLTGQFIERNPKLVLQMLADGHEIANHLYNHPHLTTLEENGLPNTLKSVNQQFIRDQLAKTDSIYQSLTGMPLRPFWRAPYGEINPEILRWAAIAGYQHIHWSGGMDTMDWVSDTTASIFRSPQEISQRLLAIDQKKHGLNGGIILMHLGNGRTTEPVYTMLPDLINQLRQKDYRFVSVSQMLSQSSSNGN